MKTTGTTGRIKDYLNNLKLNRILVDQEQKTCRRIRSVLTKNTSGTRTTEKVITGWKGKNERE